MADDRYKAATTAWLNQIAKSTTGSGKNIKPKFKRFDDFFNYAEEVEEALKTAEEKQEERKKNASIADINKLMNDYLKKKGGS